MRIAIIGPARSPLLSPAHFERMVSIASTRIRDLGATRLVSGGAAWSDHVAVQLSLIHGIPLTVYAPSDYTGRCYRGNRASSTANEHHAMMSRAMVMDSLTQIGDALRISGSTIEVHNGFRPRDNIIAERCDHMIAFSLESTEAPDTPGTSYTYSRCMRHKEVIPILTSNVKPTLDLVRNGDPPVFGFFGPYRFLSNFHIAPIIYKGATYQTTEHLYQMAKSKDPDYRAKFSDTSLSPSGARKLGQTAQLHPQWDDIRYEVMKIANQLKYLHKNEREMLIGTGSGYLEETNSWGDTYWGVCNGQGENRLGELLMEIRESLRG